MFKLQLILEIAGLITIYGLKKIEISEFFLAKESEKSEFLVKKSEKSDF